jgi:ribosomal protein L37E
VSGLGPAPGAPDATADTPRPASLCPRCGHALHDEQAWCLDCGLAARTRIHPTPNWRLPILLTALVLALLAAGLAFALVALLDEREPTPAPTTVTVPATTPPPTTPTPTTPTVTIPTTPTTPGATSTAPATGAPGGASAP